MSEKTSKYQAYVNPLAVARLITEFQREFKDCYGPLTYLGAVGPTQSFLGWAVSKGYIDVKLLPLHLEPRPVKKVWWKRLATFIGE